MTSKNVSFLDLRWWLIKIQVIQRNQVYFSSSNVSTDTTVIVRDYNQFHNILRLFNVLPNFSFTTSETMGDYYL